MSVCRQGRQACRSMKFTSKLLTPETENLNLCERPNMNKNTARLRTLFLTLNIV
jgi:hypothetical protein